jgi:hypothetical protein
MDATASQARAGACGQPSRDPRDPRDPRDFRDFRGFCEVERAGAVAVREFLTTASTIPFMDRIVKFASPNGDSRPRFTLIKVGGMRSQPSQGDIQ